MRNTVVQKWPPQAVGLLLAALIGIVFSAAAQHTSLSPSQPPHRDTQGLQLLSLGYQTIGGAQRSAISDVLMQGTLASPSAPNTAIGRFVAKARGHDFSMETTANGHHTIYRVLDGLGSINIDGTIKGLAPYKTSGLTLDIFPLFARWTEFSQSEVSVQSVGQTSLDGIPCNVVHVESPGPTDKLHANDHGKVDVCINVGSGLVDSIQYKSTEGPYTISKVTIQVRYGDYRQFEGLLVPTTVTRYVNGKSAVVLHVSQVQFTNGFADGDFKN